MSVHNFLFTWDDPRLQEELHPGLIAVVVEGPTGPAWVIVRRASTRQSSQDSPRMVRTLLLCILRGHSDSTPLVPTFWQQHAATRVALLARARPLLAHGPLRLPAKHAF